MIRTYLINRNELEKIHYSEEILSASRREKIAKVKRDDDKELSACVELLLIYALKQQLSDVSLPLTIEDDEQNKPQLKGIPMYFNMSHAGDYAVCTVSDREIGVDIEYFRVKELMNPERILHPDEAELVAFVSNPNEKKKCFYECWVAKESYLKNLGIGLVVRPRDFLVKKDILKIGDTEFSKLKGHHSPKLNEKSAGKDTTLSDNLALLKQRYVHNYEPGEVRGTDWKFDSSYRMAVCSMEKDTDNIARLISAEAINSVLEG